MKLRPGGVASGTGDGRLRVAGVGVVAAGWAVEEAQDLAAAVGARLPHGLTSGERPPTMIRFRRPPTRRAGAPRSFLATAASTIGSASPRRSGLPRPWLWPGSRA